MNLTRRLLFRFAGGAAIASLPAAGKAARSNDVAALVGKEWEIPGAGIYSGKFSIRPYPYFDGGVAIYKWFEGDGTNSAWGQVSPAILDQSSSEQPTPAGQ